MREHRLRDLLARLGVGRLEVSSSGWLLGTCPLARWTHSRGADRNPSFGAKPESGGISAFHCFTCHHRGRISSLARTLGHLSGTDTKGIEREADQADWEGLENMSFEYEGHAQRPEPLEDEMFEGIFVAAWDVPAARTYLEGRGIGEATSALLELGWDSEEGRIVFPVRDGSGRLYGFSGRSAHEAHPKIRDYSGLPKKWLILGQHRWRGTPEGDRRLLLVEGLFGYAHMVELGMETQVDVGALMGTALTQAKVDIIKQHGAPTYLLLDNDPAGDDCLFGVEGASGERDFWSGAIARLVGSVPVLVPAWPEGKVDPDQLAREDVERMLRETDSYTPPPTRKGP